MRLSHMVLASILLASGVVDAEAQVLRMPAYCKDVYDGDTVTLEVTSTITASNMTVDGRRVTAFPAKFTINVRLIDLNNVSDPDDPYVQGCWSPETWEPKGKAARESLTRMAVGMKGHLIIDLSRMFATRGPNKLTGNVSRLFTMGRILGDFHVTGYANTVARRQINAGYAWGTKNEYWTATYKRAMQPPEPVTPGPTGVELEGAKDDVVVPKEGVIE